MIGIMREIVKEDWEMTYPQIEVRRDMVRC